MRKHDKGHFIFTLFLTLFVLILLFGSLGYNKRLRIIPVTIAIPTLLFLISILIRDMIPKNKDKIREDNADPKIVIRIMGWMVIFSVGIFLLGFFVAIPLFSFAFLVTEAKLRYVASISLSIALLIGFLIIFSLALKISLWPGIVPEIYSNIIGGGTAPPL